MKNLFSKLLLLVAFVTSHQLYSQTTVVGAIDGKASVSPSGAFTYQVPIALPPGINGMMPSLSIVYNSQGGNGVMGWGWNISGMSAITRGPANLYYDNTVHPVKIDGNDEYYLDGQRLIPGAGSTYHTAIENFSIITAYSSGPTNPSYFIVEAMNGLVYEYGNSTSSAMYGSASSEIMMWQLNRIHDRSGNYVDFTYINSSTSGLYLIDEIKYGGNYNTGTTPTLTVKFNYGLKYWENTTFVYSSKIKDSHLLDKITIKSGTTQIHEYDFTYSFDRLVEIKEKGQNGTELPATVINWGPAEPFLTSHTTALVVSDPDAHSVVGDFDGDGYMDYATVDPPLPTIFWPFGTVPPKIDMYINDKNEEFSHTSTTTLPYVSSPISVMSLFSAAMGVFFPTAATDQFSRLQMDWDGDGKTDLVTISSGSTDMEVWVARSLGTSFDVPELIWSYTASTAHFQNTKAAIGDFAGIGKRQLLIAAPLAAISPVPGYFLWLLGDDGVGNVDTLIGEVKHFQAMDFDGDGKDELFTTTTGSASTRIYSFGLTYDPTTKTPAPGSLPKTLVANTSYPTSNHRIYFGDFNGDGKRDVLTWGLGAPGGGNWEIGYSESNNFFVDNISSSSLQSTDPDISITDNNIYIGDFNGDGKDDILEMYYNSGAEEFAMHTSHGVGNAFDHEVSYPMGYCGGLRDSGFAVGDFNGDGSDDILQLNSPICYNTLFFFHKNEHSRLVSSINKQNHSTPASGHTIYVDYQPLAQCSSYTPPTTTVAYPSVSVPLPMLKVATKVYDNASANTEYSYSGLLLAGWGRGSLGFQGFTQRDIVANKRSESIFDNTSFSSPVPASVKVVYPATGSAMNTIDSTGYAYAELALPYSKIVYPTSTERFDYVNNAQINTTYTYNAGSGGSYPSLENYGKADKVETNVSAGAEVTTQEFVYSTTAPNFYNQNKPQRITTTTQRGLVSAYTRISEYDYNVKGLVAHAKTDPGTSHQNTITYVYDGFGNKIKETSAVTGTPNVVLQYVYGPFGRFMVQAIDPQAHSEYYTYDTWGNVTSKKDIHNLTTTYKYDDYNRLTQTTTPTLAKYYRLYRWAPAYATCPLPAQMPSLVIEDSCSALAQRKSYTFYDLYGRTARSVKSAFGGQLLLNDQIYAADGKVSAISDPYYSGGMPSSYTYYNYDIWGHTIQSAHATKTINTTYSPINLSGVPGGFNKSITNVTAWPARVIKEEVDATGKLIDVSEALGSNVRYQYASNGKIQRTIASGQMTTYLYDAYGNTINEIAPNKGNTAFTYDNRNRLFQKTDNIAQVTQYAYDVMNRVTAKNTPDGVYTYVYGTTFAAMGQIIQVNTPYTSTNTYYTYDVFARLKTLSETVNGNTFVTSYTYDLLDRLQQTTYPNGLQVKDMYNQWGYATGVRQDYGPWVAPVDMYWRKDAENEYGQLTQASFGPDISPVAPGATPNPSLFVETNAYTATGGLTLSKLTDHTGTIFHARTLHQVDEATGDMTMRQDLNRGLLETFMYDQSDRVTRTDQILPPPLPTPPQVDFVYDPNGNMIKKTDVTQDQWVYQNYAVKAINLPVSAIPSLTQKVDYNYFNKVTRIDEGGQRIEFKYKADDQRGEADYYSSGTLTKTRYYAHNFEKTVDAAGNVQEICYIMANGKPVAMHVRDNGIDHIYSLYTDHLGSITHIFSNVGTTLVEERSYDLWGRPRDPNTWDYTGLPAYAFDRGYTGQEHLWDFNVVNLNGRLYDPLIGRMMGVDKYISNPANPQAYNSYSYAMNNPLKYTDKDGNNPLIAVYAVAGIVGGAINVYNNWDKISKNPWSSVGYFASGAIGGAMAITNPMGAGAVTAAGNIATDIMYGNVPKINNAVDGLGYLSTSILDGYTASSTGGMMGEVASALTFSWGWSQTAKATAEPIVGSFANGYTLPAVEFTHTTTVKIAFSAGRSGGLIAAESASGQMHHLLSRKILGELERHPTLNGVFSREDPRFIYKAADQAAHRGYQDWHRLYDKKVIDWLKDFPNASPTNFVDYLNSIHQEAWLLERIPGVYINW